MKSAHEHCVRAYWQKLLITNGIQCHVNVMQFYNGTVNLKHYSIVRLFSIVIIYYQAQARYSFAIFQTHLLVLGFFARSLLWVGNYLIAALVDLLSAKSSFISHDFYKQKEEISSSEWYVISWKNKNVVQTSFELAAITNHIIQIVIPQIHIFQRIVVKFITIFPRPAIYIWLLMYEQRLLLLDEILCWEQLRW